MYKNDPRWITARFNSTCGCGKAIKKGDRCFYYPSSRVVMCDGDNCGAKASAEFEGCKQDEAMMAGTTW